MADYEIEVDVAPNASRFHRDLSEQIRDEERRADAVKVDLDPSVSKEFRTKATRSVRKALKDLDAAVTVNPEVTKAFRRDLQRAVKEVTRGEAIEVPVTATLGRRFRSDLQKQVKAATAEKPIEVGVQAKAGPGFRGKLQKSITEALAAKPLTADVNLQVSKRGFAAFTKEVQQRVAEATTAVSATEAASIELRADGKALGPQIAAEVAAATEGVSATEAASVEIRADTKGAAAEVAAVGAAADGSSAKMSTFAAGSAIALGGIVVAAGLAGAALYGIGSAFDDAYDSIQTKTGAAGADLRGLKDQFREVAATTPSDFESIATAVGGVNARLDVGAGTSEILASQLLNLSRITGTELEPNLENVTSALQSFQVPAEDMPGALDAIFRASQNSGVGVDQLASSLMTSGAALRTAGFDFEESTALLAQLQKAGVPAEQVIGSLSIAARKLAKDGKDPAKGIAELVDQIKAAKSPTEALAIAQATFGRGAVGVTDAIRSGKFELSGFLDEVKAGGSTIQGTSADTADAAESFQLLKNNLALILEEPAAGFFQDIGDVVKQLAPVLKELAPSISALVGGLGDVATGLLQAILPVIEELVPALAPIGKILGQAFAGLGPILGPLAGALGQILAAVAPLLPVFGQLIGIVAKTLVPVISGLADALAPVIALLADQFGDVLTSLAPIVVQLGTALGELLGEIGPVLVQVLQGALKEIAPILPDLADAGILLAQAFADLLVALLPLLPPLIQLAVRFFTKPNILLITLAARALAFMAEALVPLVAGVADLLASGIDKVLDFTSGLADLDADKIQAGLAGIGHALAEGLGNAAQAVLDFVTDIPNELGKIPGLIGSAITTAVPALLIGLGGIAIAIGTWFVTDAIPFVITKAGELAAAFLGWIAETIVTLPIELAKIIAYILLWLGITAVQLGIKAHELATSFLGWIGQTLIDLPGKLVSIALAIYSWVTTTGPELAAKALALAGSFLGWTAQVIADMPGKLAEIATGIFTWILELPGKIIDLVTTLGPELAKVGVGLITGMFNGLADAAGIAADIASDVGGAIVDFINDHVIDAINDSLEFDFKVKGIGISIDPPDIPHLALAKGALVTKPTLALIGEAGDELVLPLSDPARMAELIAQAGLSIPLDPNATASAAGAGAGALGAVADAAAATGPNVDGLQAWVDASVALLATVPGLVQAATVPGLTEWELAVEAIFDALTAKVRATTTATAADLYAWATFGLPQATLPGLALWRAAIATQLAAFQDNAAAQAGSAASRSAAAWQAGLDVMELAAGTSGARIADALVTKLEEASARITKVATSYRDALAAAMNPILSAAGQPQLRFKDGGKVERFARGGYVPGPDVNRDVVPALLMPGEVVIRKASVEQFGLGNMLALNDGRRPAGWQVPGYADGGQVTGDTEGLNGEFMRRLSLWSGALGETYNVQSGYRSIAEQAVLYAKYLAGNGPIAAVPGSSMHNFGLASDGNHWKARHPELFGLRFTVPSEAWHVEPVEARQWAKNGGAPDGAGAGGAGVMAGLVPFPEVPGADKLGKGSLATTAAALMGFTRQQALDWATSVQIAQPGTLEPGGAGTAGSSAAAGWVRQAMALAGVGPEWFAGLMTIAKRESNYDPTAVNRWDSNARAGHPSKGIMQMIDSTFRANALPGLGNIFDPIANIAAAIRYIESRYGSIGAVQQANPNLPPKGYALGGLVTTMAGDTIGLTRGWGGGAPAAGSKLHVAGDVNVSVTPPGSHDPESYAAALGHRAVPILAAVADRTS